MQVSNSSFQIGRDTMADITDIVNKLDQSKPENMALAFIAQNLSALVVDIKNVKASTLELERTTMEYGLRICKVEEDVKIHAPDKCLGIKNIYRNMMWIVGAYTTINTGITLALFKILSDHIAK
jgi:hypothetical protein